MTILFICDEYPPGKNGGIGTSVQNLGRELVAQGHKVIVAGLYSYRYGEKNADNDNGVQVYRQRYGLKLPVGSNSKLYGFIEKLPNAIKRKLNGEKAFRNFIAFINGIIEKESVDIIEIGDYNNFCSHIGFVVQWPRFKVPMLLKSHGSHTYFNHELNIPPNELLHATDKLLFERADDLASVSRYTADVNQQLFNISKPVKVLYNGIELAANPSNSIREASTVIFTGSLAYKKGIFSLIKAWNLVHEKHPEARLILYGKGKPTMFRALLHPKTGPSVFFRGHVNKDELQEALQKTTLAVFPSYTETFGLGVVEAMGAACPVIYTKRSCGPEIVQDNVDGLLVDPANIEDIANAIIKLLNNETLRNTLAANGYRTAQTRFNIKNIAAQHVAYYQQVIQNFKAS